MEPSADWNHQNSLHDFLKIGEIADALTPGESTNSVNDERAEKIHRLPLFLRLLSATRPLSSIPLLTAEEGFSESKEPSADFLVDTTVKRLEEVAASYSVAEGVDELVSNLAPSISRKISKLKPLKRVHDECTEKALARDFEGTWDTRELEVVAASPIGGPRKKRRVSLHADEEKDSDSDDEIVTDNLLKKKDLVKADKGDPATESRQIKPGSESINDNNQKANSGAAVFTLSSEDSHESMAIKTLSELASLVVSSLKESVCQSGEEAEDGKPQNAALSLMSDSFLLDDAPLSDSADDVGAYRGSDLGATVATLMYHAPVLRHRHVANALCRIAAPQSPGLIARIAANSPSMSQCLVQGCIDAYQLASSSRSSTSQLSDHAICSTAATSLRALAQLSASEKVRVVASLHRNYGVMPEVMLELSIPDACATAAILLQYLSSGVPQSIARSQRYIRKTCRANGSRPHQATNLSVSLADLLQDNQELGCSVCDCLIEGLNEWSSSGNELQLGRTALLLRAFSLLLLRVQFQPATQAKSKIEGLLPRFFLTTCSLGEKLIAFIGDIAPESPSSTVDNFYQQLVMSCLIASARHYQIGEGDGNGTESSKVVVDFFQRMFSLNVSAVSDVFASRLAGFLRRQEGEPLYNFMFATVLHCSSYRATVFETGFIGYTVKLCQFLSLRLELQLTSKRGFMRSSVVQDATALLEAIATGDIQGSQLCHTLNAIFCDPVSCKEALRSCKNVRQLLERSVAVLVNQSKRSFPLVMPIELESLARRVKWHQFHDEGYQFLVQLGYCLAFYEQNPNSPFTVEPVDLPLKEAYLTSCFLYEKGMVTKSFITLLLDLAPLSVEANVLPDATTQPDCAFRENEVISDRELLITALARIRSYVYQEQDEQSGASAERAFLVAREKIPSTDFESSVVGALLSHKNSPIPFFTESMLIRDPLTILKCPMSVWRSPGLRRIALTILTRLMVSNIQIVERMPQPEKCTMELLAARDVVISRCLIMASCGFSQNGSRLQPFHCSMTIHTVRMIVTRHTGIIATLIKQGLPDCAVDWIVEFIPESIADAEALTMLLADSGSQTATERLRTADASLRIAIAHEPRDESAAQKLAYSGLSVLVSSFFLVIGPVGVPVNVLREENGDDVTQICKNAMFRMFAAIQKIHGRDAGVMNECATALQKLAGLCKGESILSGVAGVVALRRKKVLKEVWDELTRSVNTLGSSIQM